MSNAIIKQQGDSPVVADNIWEFQLGAGSVPERGYHELGELIAWKATLWDGSKLLAEQKSFLWQG